ncbi:hypothetical protein JCM10212_003957 [Sporobolomyces blumeae]
MTSVLPVLDPASTNPQTLDADSLALVSAILEQDLQDLQDHFAAEQLQLQLALDRSRPPSPLISSTPSRAERGHKPLIREDEPDHLVATRQQLSFVHSAQSKNEIVHCAIEELKAANDARIARDLRDRLEVEKKKLAVDREFARTLQKADQDGYDMDQLAKREAKGLLGEAKVKQMMGKGKARAMHPPEEDDDIIIMETPPPPYQPPGQYGGAAGPNSRHEPYRGPRAPVSSASSSSTPLSARAPPFPTPKGQPGARPTIPVAGTVPAPPPPAPAVDPRLPDCSMCLEPCRPVSDPYAMSLKSSTSTGVPYGIFFGNRNDNHVACLGCATTYIQKKLEDKARIVFPIRCPECTYELTDDDALKILGRENCENWHFRKLLDSSPIVFCPNPRCSERVLRPSEAESKDSQAICPACHVCVCYSCEVTWHVGYTCEEFQALPLSDRNPEDAAMLALAKEQKWSRCPECRVVIERTHGCDHITCSQCGKEHCYNCGSPWLKVRGDRNGKCSRNPPCALWADERVLLNPAERGPALAPAPAAMPRPGANGAGRPPVNPAPAPPHLQANAPFVQILPQQAEVPHLPSRDRRATDRVEWTSSSLSKTFLVNLDCGYCNRSFGRRHGVRQHLAGQTQHDVYACSGCSRFFRARAHLQQHLGSNEGTGRCTAVIKEFDN